MDASWKAFLVDEFTKPYFRSLAEFVRAERESHTVFPAAGNVFEAFKVTPFDRVRVVILGQDPYPNAGQAHGLSFSVLPGVQPPRSLLNIYKELESDLGVKPAKHGHLLKWAEQGVFLLNSILTVRAHEPGSHQGRGWERFTDRVIGLLNARAAPVVFILWGSYAKRKASFLDAQRHMIIEGVHPSPMSAHNGFFGSRPFSAANMALEDLGFEPIDWALPESP